MELDYSELSYQLTKSISKEEKTANGIFFTPPRTIHETIRILAPYMSKVKNVLEPSCGSCEYVLALNKSFKKVEITGIEYNETIYHSIKKLATDKMTLIQEDYLKFTTDTRYDLIIGNPPYFVMKKNAIEKEYHDYFDGRPNIFILFIMKSLTLLSENGILSFVLPKNFLNCLYYDKTRKYISQHCKIIDIIYCDDDYIETKQETIVFIVQKKKVSISASDSKNNDTFILNTNGYTIFGTRKVMSEIKVLYHNSTTLEKMGFEVNVGNVVWNQCKDILTDDVSKTLLIYSSDIKNNKLAVQKYKNKDKKNYIHKKGVDKPILVVNRGYGVGDYNFQYCLIEGGFEYLIENHLICIKYTKTIINNEELIVLYQKIINSLGNEKTRKFIDLYFGNNAINTTELCKLVPFYDI
jgi:adenine-specific DNA-methyltransferase